MAESPPRSGAPDSASGDDLDAAQVVEDGAASAPWGRARPWWSLDSGGGTGPLQAVNGTGGHPMAGGSGAHPVVGSGAHPVVGSGAHPVVGSGAHPVVGSGAHPVVGTGGHPIVHGGTGPLPAAPSKKRRVPRLLLVAGATAVAAVALMAGALVFRTGGGDAKDARTTALPRPRRSSTRVRWLTGCARTS